MMKRYALSCWRAAGWDFMGSLGGPGQTTRSLEPEVHEPRAGWFPTGQMLGNVQTGLRMFPTLTAML